MRWSGTITVEVDCIAETEEEAIEKALEEGRVAYQYLYSYEEDDPNDEYDVWRENNL